MFYGLGYGSYYGYPYTGVGNFCASPYGCGYGMGYGMGYGGCCGGGFYGRRYWW